MRSTNGVPDTSCALRPTISQNDALAPRTTPSGATQARPTVRKENNFSIRPISDAIAPPDLKGPPERLSPAIAVS
jgi:hypothetical protein